MLLIFEEFLAIDADVLLIALRISSRRALRILFTMQAVNDKRLLVCCSFIGIVSVFSIHNAICVVVLHNLQLSIAYNNMFLGVAK